MIITEHFVFIHMHKTGGQTLNNIIERCIPDHQVIGYHFPRSDIPPESADLPVVGMIRNPWDWYVSWYAFNRRPNMRNPLFNIVSDGGNGTFKTTVTNLIQLGSDRPESVQHREELIRILPESLDGNRGVGLTKESIRELSGAGMGYYAWLSKRMLGKAPDDQTFVGRFENLQDEFLAIMEQLSVNETGALKLEFEKRERKNVSRHSHYSHYYDDELRNLVAEKERAMIETYNYQFESMKPPGVSYEFDELRDLVAEKDHTLLDRYNHKFKSTNPPAASHELPVDKYAGKKHGFRKLLGREKNFLRLNDTFDTDMIRKAIEAIPAERWLESERERLFDVHRDTQALLMVHFEDYQYKKPEHRKLFFEFQDQVQPVVDYVADYYQNNGFIVRLILARLVAGGKIPKHTDAGFSLLNCHRIHLPIITNKDVAFFVGDEERNMQVGELWEINNGTVHAVENRGTEDRVHLIVDWMPNYAGKSEEDILTADPLEGTDSEAANAAMLGSIITQAYKLQQSGQTAKAESLYRQVLHFDNDHVVGNNLMGLLCLQTQRLDEAVQHIEKALSVKPDDAQAHSNLGLAFNGLNRLEDAARHFHESLKLNPNNARVYNNLGNIYVRQNRIKDAITCYKQALAIQPAFAEVHLNLGSAWLFLKQYSEAVASLQQCVALNPELTEGRIKLDQALRALGKQG